MPIAKPLKLLMYAFFAFGCTLISIYSLRYLAVQFNPHNPFHVSFADAGWMVPAHLFAAGVALLIAPLQVSGKLRARWPSVHRCTGWLYAATVAIGGVAGVFMAFRAQGGWSTGSSFLSLALLWMGTTGLGIYYATQKRYTRHRQWMLRSVALTFSGVTLRIYLGLGLGVFGLQFADAYLIAAWLSWPLNLLLLEIYLRRHPMTVSRTAAPLQHVSDTRSASHPASA